MMKYFMSLTAVLMAVLLAGCAQDITKTEEPELPLPIILPAVPAPEPEPQARIMGWVERIKISDIETTPKAKLDSGATTSSIHAEIIRKFERDGKEHIVFRVDLGDEENSDEQIFEAPVERWVQVVRRTSEETIRRPVVKMTFCLGNEIIEGEVNLADRSNFIYPVLIGRNMLEDRILIDSSKTFTQPPSCN